MRLDNCKIGIYVDHDNLIYGIGRDSMDYSAVKTYFENKGAIIVRANTYMAVDYMAEKDDQNLQKKNNQYRSSIRKQGFKVIEKSLARYAQPSGNYQTKANMDLELAIDALCESHNLDFVVIASGDGDFCYLVEALQHRGKRVSIFARENISGKLERTADEFIPIQDVEHFWDATEVSQEEPLSEWENGFIQKWMDKDSYGFITRDKDRDKTNHKGIFFHYNDVLGEDGVKATKPDLVVHHTTQKPVRFRTQKRPGKKDEVVAVEVVLISGDGNDSQ